MLNVVLVVVCIIFFLKSHTLMMMKRHKKLNWIFWWAFNMHVTLRYGLLIDKRVEKYFLPQCHVLIQFHMLLMFINDFPCEFFLHSIISSVQQKIYLWCCDFTGLIIFINIIIRHWLQHAENYSHKSMHSNLMNKLILCKFVVNNKICHKSVLSLFISLSTLEWFMA